MTTPRTMAIIGGGKLGKPIIQRLLHSGLFKPGEINISRKDKSRLVELKQFFPGCNVRNTNLEAIKNAQIIILAVRPQDTQSVGEELKGKLKEDQIILSVVTAKTTKKLSAILGTNNILRCSTNILLESGEAFSFWYGDADLPQNLVLACESIIKSWGKARRCESETELKQAIVDSGSFVGLIMVILQAFIMSMIARGRNAEEATELVLSQTAAIARRALEKQITPSQIATQVRTPGGITNQACEIYAQANLEKTIHDGNLAADQKVEELS